MNDTIRYIGDFTPGTGFNTALRGYLRALQYLGLDASKVRGVVSVGLPIGASTDDTMPVEDWTYHYLRGMWRDEPPINIVHTHASRFGDFYTANKYNIAVVAWETDKLPARQYEHFGKKATVAESLNKFDECWVPTRWVGGLLRDSGVNPRNGIHVIPHALLPEYAEAAARLTSKNCEEVNLLSIGTWNPRKNMEQLFQTYAGCGWSPLDGVRLDVCCVPPARDGAILLAHSRQANEHVQAILQGLPDGPESAPSFGLYTTYVDEKRVIERYKAAHVFLSTSRGEAFQLPAMEAAAFGCWIIGGGPWLQELAEIAGTLDEGGLVDLVPTQMIPIAPMPEVTGYEIGQKWWHVDGEALQEALVSAVSAIKETGSFEGTLKWAEKVRQHYSVRRIAGLIAKRLAVATEEIEGSAW